MSPTRVGEAESNPLFFRASSATFNAPETSTMLGRNPDMRRNVPTAPSLAPPESSMPNKMKVHNLHMHVRGVLSIDWRYLPE